MYGDEVLDEIRRVRAAYAERFGFDVHAMARDLMEKQKAGGRTVVRLPPRPAIRETIGARRRGEG